VEGLVTLTNDPAEALKDADVVITDTWSVEWSQRGIG
jgi:ornithine carbamoyltransferase